jgi:Cation/multidrug efflux pump
MKLKIVELPPGPPVLASLVAEVYGRPEHTYGDLVDAARKVTTRFRDEPGVADVYDTSEVSARKLVFVADQEKAALAGVSVADIAATIRVALEGDATETVRMEGERNPLKIVVRLPRVSRSSDADLARLQVKGTGSQMVPLAELGRWENAQVDQTIYHKNLERVAYVFGETVGRPPAECVVDIMADRTDSVGVPMTKQDPRPVRERTYVRNGSGIPWSVPEGVRVEFAGEGEWKITLDVFRDLGLAFGARC